MKTKTLITKTIILIPFLSTAQNQTFTTTSVQKIYAQSTSEIQCYHHDKPFTEIIGDQSKIKIKDHGIYAHNTKIIIKTNLTDVQFFQSDGASGIYINSPITSNITLKSLEASTIKANIQNKKTTCTADNAASIQLSGNTDSLIFFADNASSIKTQNLIATHIKFKLENASAGSVFPDSSITGSINTASSLKIYGSPKVINIEKSDNTSEIKYKNTSDTSHPKKNKSFYYKWKYSSKYKSWEGISFGINGYFTSNNDINLPLQYNYMQLDYSQCFNFQLNITQINLNIYKKHIAFATGFGFEWKRFAFDNNVNLNPDTSFTYGVIDSTKTFSYKRNILKASYLQLPLLIEFHFGKHDKINIDAGIIAQVKLSSRTRQIREKDNFIYDITRRDSYNLNPFLFKYHFSVGINYFSVFAEYTFTPLFQTNKGPLLYPFNVGIRWNIF